MGSQSLPENYNIRCFDSAMPSLEITGLKVALGIPFGGSQMNRCCECCDGLHRNMSSTRASETSSNKVSSVSRSREITIHSLSGTRDGQLLIVGSLFGSDI